MTALEVAKVLVVGYALLACSLVGRALRLIGRVDAHSPCPCHVEDRWDETWVDAWPADTWPKLTAVEVQRRFADIAAAERARWAR